MGYAANKVNDIDGTMQNGFRCPFQQVDTASCDGDYCPVSVSDGDDTYCAFAVIPGILNAMRQDIKRIGGER